MRVGGWLAIESRWSWSSGDDFTLGLFYWGCYLLLSGRVESLDDWGFPLLVLSGMLLDGVMGNYAIWGLRAFTLFWLRHLDGVESAKGFA